MTSAMTRDPHEEPERIAIQIIDGGLDPDEAEIRSRMRIFLRERDELDAIEEKRWNDPVETEKESLY